MRLRSVRGPRSLAAVAAGVALLVLLAGCAAGGAATNPTRVSAPTDAPGQTTVRVLQLNLCNSGRAACYTGGRAVGLATELIHEDLPSMVTLNEVCRDDVSLLKRAMSTTFHGAAVATAFEAAHDRSSQAPVLCQNGQEFGDGVVALVPSAAPRSRSYGGLYPLQDPNDVEERTWACVDLVTRFLACTTHTASTSTTLALAQCRYLLTSALPTARVRDVGDPIILGADLNLAATGSPNAESCLPPGYQRTDDGALQDVVASPGLEIRARWVIDMRGTTDHPGLLVDIVLPRR